LPIAVALFASSAAVAFVLPGGRSGNEAEPALTVAPGAAVLAGYGRSVPGPPSPPPEGLAPNYEQVLGMAALGDTLVAVGERAARPRDERPDLSEPLAWWSVDGGERWEPAVLGDLGNAALTSVAADGNRFVAVGWRPTPRGSKALVLVSTDGRAWTEERVDGAGVLLHTAVATPNGAVLAGRRDDLSGLVPVVFVPEKDGWRQVVLLGHANGSEAEIRGSCADRGEITLVGMVRREGDREALVLRSTDAGKIWRPLVLPGPALVGTDGRANTCAAAGGRTAIAGTTTIRGYDRAFVSVEDDGRWQDAFLLEPANLQRQGHTVARAAAIVGSEIVVLGHDSSNDNGQGDLASWRNGLDGWVRLGALEALGSGHGVGEARTAIAHRGVLVVGGTSGDRSVVWRTSPGAAVIPPPEVAVPAPTPWWVAHGEDDLCRMAPAGAVQAALGPVPAMPQLLPEPAGPTVSCTWLTDDGETALLIQIAPSRRLDVLAANYQSAGIGAPQPVAGVCQDGTYYPAFATLAARCGETGVAVGGLPQDKAIVLMKAFVTKLPD